MLGGLPVAPQPTRRWLPSWSRRRPMRVYLVGIWLAAALAVAGAIGYGFVWSAGQARAEAIERMTFRADKAAESVAAGVVDSRAALEAVIAQPELEAVFVTPEGCSLTLPAAGPFLEPRMDLVGRDGSVACTSDSSPRVRGQGVHQDSAWFDRALHTGDAHVDWDGTDPATGQSAVVVAAAFGGTPTRPAGAAAIFLPSAATAMTLADDLVSTDHATSTLVDESSTTIVSSSGGGVLPSADAGAFGGFDAVDGEWAGLDGAQRLFGSAEVADSPWRVFMGAERSAAVASVHGALVREAWIGLLALGLVGRP